MKERKKDSGSSKFLLSQDCVEDVVSPIILRLNFSLVGDSASSGNLRPVLAVGSQDHVTASVSTCPVESRDRVASLCHSVLKNPQQIPTAHQERHTQGCPPPAS